VLVALAVAVLYPIFFTINVALMTPAGFRETPFALAWPPSSDALATIWDRARIPRSLTNSLGVSAASVMLLWIVGSLAGFAVAKLRFPGRNLMFMVILLPLLIPLQAILVPFFLVMKQLGLLNQHIGLILAYAAFLAPITTFMFAAYFRGIPPEVTDAAKVDGASTLRMLWSVILPMSLPALALTGVLNFVSTMNQLMLPILIMSNPERQVLMVNLAMVRGQWEAEPTLSAAGTLFGILPMLVIGLVGSRYLVKAAVAGAVK
jgi:multiple sugar transport system permease protein